MQEQDIHTMLEDAAPPSGLPSGFADGVMVALEARARTEARLLRRRRMIGATVLGALGLLALTGGAALFPAVWFYVKMAVLPVVLVVLVQCLDVKLVQVPMFKKQIG